MSTIEESDLSSLKVSVGIVTYNDEDIILDCLKSIYKHTRGIQMEVYLYDNCSQDKTVELVLERYPQVWLIRGRRNRGFGYGHNRILKKVDSNYHVILNPDILFRSNAIHQMAAFMEDHPDVVMAQPKLLNPDGSEQFTPKRAPSFKYMMSGRLQKLPGPFKKWRDEYTMKNEPLVRPTDIYFMAGCFMMARTNVLKEVGGFDTRYFLYNEDVDLTRTMRQKGRCVFVPQVAVVHMWQRGYMKSPKLFRIQLSSMFKYFRKWRGQKYE